jgi:hypothetical protein
MLPASVGHRPIAWLALRELMLRIGGARSVKCWRNVALVGRSQRGCHGIVAESSLLDGRPWSRVPLVLFVPNPGLRRWIRRIKPELHLGRIRQRLLAPLARRPRGVTR